MKISTQMNKLTSNGVTVIRTSTEYIFQTNQRVNNMWYLMNISKEDEHRTKNETKSTIIIIIHTLTFGHRGAISVEMKEEEKNDKNNNKMKKRKWKKKTSKSTLVFWTCFDGTLDTPIHPFRLFIN